MRKKPWGNNTISRLLQGFWLHTQREDGLNNTSQQIPPTQRNCCNHNKMLYKNTKVKVRSPDRDTDYFDIVASVQLGGTLALYLFIICLVYVLRTSIDLMKGNGVKLAKERSRRYPEQTITDAEYADDISLLANTPAQSESLVYCLERAGGGIGLHVNAYKAEYTCFNQRNDISTLKSEPLKLVDKVTYQGSSVSSTENDINTRLAKGWSANDRLSVMWKSDLTDKI